MEIRGKAVLHYVFRLINASNWKMNSQLPWNIYIICAYVVHMFKSSMIMHSNLSYTTNYLQMRSKQNSGGRSHWGLWRNNSIIS